MSWTLNQARSPQPCTGAAAAARCTRTPDGVHTLLSVQNTPQRPGAYGMSWTIN